MPKILVPDTNVLMQSLPLDRVDWGLLGLGEEVTVLVPLPVHREINRFKTDSGNPRRARRARIVSKWLADATDHPPYVIRGSSPRVTIAANPHPWKAVAGNGLDLTDPDQEIAGYALALMAKDSDVLLLTGDSGLIGIARAEGIPVVRTPDEWMPVPEADPKDKVIQEQRARIAELEQAFPKVSCSVLDGAGDDLHRVQIEAQQYLALSTQEVGQLAQRAYQLRPYNSHIGAEVVMQRQLEDFVSRFGPTPGRRIAPGPEEFVEYQEHYQRWSGQLPKALGEAHLALSRRETVLQTILRLENTGGAPAKDVRLELVSDPGFLLLSSSEPDALKPIYPVPPRRPEARTEGELAADVAASGFFKKKPDNTLDPRRFSWAATAGSRLEANCQDWYHQVEPVDLVVYLHAAARGPEAIKTSVRIRLTSSNVPRPVEVVLPVEISFAPASVRALAEQTLLEELEQAK